MTVLAAALLAVGCGDLALEPDRVPTSLLISPEDTLITEGDDARLIVTVLDQDGDAFSAYPSWAPPEWVLSDPDAVAIGPDGQVETLGGGEVHVTARLAGLSTEANLRVNPSSVALSAPAIYLIQAVQDREGSVPLVAGRDALLRVFVTGDRISFYQPTGRVTLYQGDTETHSTLLFPDSYLIPDDVDESRMDRSFNSVIPGDVLQPGVELVVELDVESAVPLAPGSQLRIPASGRTPLDVRVLPPMELTVVPVLLESDPNPQIFGFTGGLTATSDRIQLVRSALPIGDFDVAVHDAYTTSSDLTTEAGWRSFLQEMSVLRVTDGSSRYYYGAVVLPQGSVYGGLGYVGRPISVGRHSGTTLAHELGHNMSLLHAPCGGVAGFDGAFPHDGGGIGVWGYDFAGGAGLGDLVDPDQYKDLMGYCNPRWVSDYHFTKALEFRENEEGAALQSATRADVSAREEVLLLWGSVADGELVLEPALHIEAPPTLPQEAGPYRIEGRDDSGGTLFALSFAPHPVARGGAQFTFTVPMSGAAIERLELLTLSGPEGEVAVDRSTRLPPATFLIDDATGGIRAIIRDDPAPISSTPGTRVATSSGLPESLPLPEGR